MEAAELLINDPVHRNAKLLFIKLKFLSVVVLLHGLSIVILTAP